MKDNRQYNIVSLFSGCGGADIGMANAYSDTINTDIEESPFNFLWSNDAMKHACKTLARNFDKTVVENIEETDEEDVVFCGDVRGVDFSDISEKSDVDVVVGGFPCQDFSILRGKDNRGGIKVERGKLYMEFARSLAQLQPEIFVAENVKGLVSANDGKAYDQIIEDFQSLDKNWDEIEMEYDRETYIETNHEIDGYDILHSKVVDFSNHGIPQGRKRLIIIGLRKDLTSNLSQDISKLRSDISDRLLRTKPFDEAPLTTIEAFTGNTLNSLDNEYEKIMKSYKDYIERIDSERAEEYRDNIWPKYTFDIWKDYRMINDISSELNSNTINDCHEQVLKTLGYRGRNLEDSTYDDDSNEEMREQEHVSERLRHIPPGENHRMVKNTEHHISAMMSNIYKRVHPLKYSPTVIASGGGGTWGYHYEIERGKLTNRERARIQTFPDDFTFYGNNSEVRKQIGNAIPPLGAKKIGEVILDILNDI